MKVVRMNDVAKETVVNPLFTGPDVTRQDILPESEEYRVNIVNFGKGIRNKFHRHDSEQILVITSGKGIVATKTEEVVVTAGDVILFQAGENHWHGATEDSEFSHLYVMKKGSKHLDVKE